MKGNRDQEVPEQEEEIRIELKGYASITQLYKAFEELMDHNVPYRNKILEQIKLNEDAQIHKDIPNEVTQVEDLGCAGTSDDSCDGT